MPTQTATSIRIPTTHTTRGMRPVRRRSIQRASAGPVVLLHGFASTARVMLPLERALRRRLGRPVVRLPISPGAEDLRDSALAVMEALNGMAPYGTDRIDLVGHSMGGLVATYLLKRLDRGERVRSVITLGTPHRGTPLAHAGGLVLGALSPAMRQMRPGSPFLTELEALPVPSRSQLISIAGSRDLLVSASRAELEPTAGQRNAVLDGASHVKLLFAKESLELVGNLLAQQDGRRHLSLAA